MEIAPGCDGLLVMFQADYPGWTAVVDEASRPILRVNALVEGGWVPPGSRPVVLL